MEKKYVAVPFALVGLFTMPAGSKVEDMIRDDIEPEELEKFQEILARLLFKEGVKVAVYPSILPPDQASSAVEELEKMIFGEGNHD